MEVIPSFQIDHTDLKPGIYVSRKDYVGSEPIVTYDIRMIHVNHEPAISPAAMHTIEHLAATYLRNDDYWKDYVIYWGPMGCLTGSYFIVKGNHDIEEIKDLMVDMFLFIFHFEGDIPGAKKEECGNYTLHNLDEAKYAAEEYIASLVVDFEHEYPTVK